MKKTTLTSLRGSIPNKAEAIHDLLIASSAFGLLAMTALVSGCSPQSADAAAEKPAVIINQLRLNAQELEQEKRDLDFSHQEVRAGTGEPEWLSRLIERELLVQEAQRLGLDREPEFMRTIERFWKEALIKLLLERKIQEISDRIHVYDPEIEARYQKITTDAPAQITARVELREDIRQTLREEKQAEAMEQWVSELRSKSHVVINKEAFGKLS
jgi:hypothetical protein